MTFVDTNVIVDVLSDDPHWAEWSAAALESAAANGQLTINIVVYAELCGYAPSKQAVDGSIEKLRLEVMDMPRDALFLAGKAFVKYRQAGGTRTGVLPDFFIGAHAAATGLPLLTRDARRYRTYFPTVELIAPDNG